MQNMHGGGAATSVKPEERRSSKERLANFNVQVKAYFRQPTRYEWMSRSMINCYTRIYWLLRSMQYAFMFQQIGTYTL
jgi:hypothetical protein